MHTHIQDTPPPPSLTPPPPRPQVRRGDTVTMMNTNTQHTLDEVGVLAPSKVPVDALFCGEVGYLAAHIRSVHDARVGDTVTNSRAPAGEALAGYREAQPVVYCGLFPTDADDYQVCWGRGRGVCVGGGGGGRERVVVGEGEGGCRKRVSPSTLMPWPQRPIPIEFRT